MQWTRAQWFENTSSPVYRLLLLGFPLLSASVVCLLVPFTAPMQGYWRDAQQLAYHGKILQHFAPAGYPELLACGIVLLPAHPVIAVCILQSLVHCLCTCLLWALLRSFRLSAKVSLWAAILIGLHPELLFSVPKVWDVAWSTALLLAIVYIALAIARGGPTRNPLLVALGLALGIGILDRPNLLVLLPAAFLVVWLAPERRAGRHRRTFDLAAICVILITTTLTYVAGAELAYGHFDLPHNGPYNLYAGQNAGSARMLLTDLNGEPSIAPAIAAAGYQVPYMTWHYDWLGPVYLKLSLAFARQHPLLELQLIGIKFLTLFRPDTKVHSFRDRSALAKVLLAFPAPIWLLLLGCLCRRPGQPLLDRDRVILCVAALYILPFLLTNSDPRFRIPLDLLMMAHSVDLASRLRSGRKLMDRNPLRPRQQAAT